MEAVHDLVRSHVSELAARHGLQKPVVGPQALDLVAESRILLEERDGLLTEPLSLGAERQEPGNTVVPEDERAEDRDDRDQQDDRQHLASAPPHAGSLVTESVQRCNGRG